SNVIDPASSISREEEVEEADGPKIRNACQVFPSLPTTSGSPFRKNWRVLFASALALVVVSGVLAWYVLARDKERQTQTTLSPVLQKNSAPVPSAAPTALPSATVTFSPVVTSSTPGPNSAVMSTPKPLPTSAVDSFQVSGNWVCVDHGT